MQSRCDDMHADVGVSDAARRSPVINWTRCIICQTDTDESLQCPADSKRCDTGAGYESFADILPKFQAADVLPSHMHPAYFDEGSGICATLSAHDAKWHKSCRLRFYSRELERACARKSRQAGVAPSNVADVSVVGSPVKCRSLTSKRSHVHSCFFCDEPETPGEKLRDVMTLELDRKVKQCANKLQDNKLLVKLSNASDMVALEAKYHLKCLASLYNRVRSIERKQSFEPNKPEHTKSLVFAQLVSYIDECRLDDSAIPVFRLGDLVKLYNERFTQLGGLGGAHSTRLKEQLLAQFPDMHAYDEGRDVLLMFDYDVGPTVAMACQIDWQRDALCLSRVAQIVRQDIFQFRPAFDGFFQANCQEQSVPSSLLALVSMILEGPSISNQTCKQQVPAALELAQLIVYNSVNHARPHSEQQHATKQVRHRRQQETPFPLYAGLYLYAKTRKAQIVSRMSKLGVSVSYDRILSLTSDLASTVSETYKRQQVVCPPQLHKDVFTVGAVDNIDHNPTSTYAKGSFHGTAISLMQHPMADSMTHQSTVTFTSSKKKSLVLPEYYTAVDAVMLKSVEPDVPEIMTQIPGDSHLLPSATAHEYAWLNFVRLYVASGCHAADANLTWSAFNSQAHPRVQKSTSCAVTGLLPLFREASNSVAMIKHAMDVIAVAIEHLNSGQTPVMACDQPLYALAKIIQWNFPELYGESRFVIMLGGLHVEMAGLKALGSFMSGSGWVEAITDAGLCKPGTAESFLSAAHVRRCRRAHEVTAASLYVLQQRAFASYKTSCSEMTETLSFDDWHSRQVSAQPQFAFWTLVLECELAVFAFVRSIRSANFQQYIASLQNLVPWFFIMDRTHYARWLPVHIRDMVELQHSNPGVFQEFSRGRFTVNKTNRSFSAIAIDHAHEQINATVKGDGGVIGLTENENALRRWLIAAPEIARLLDEFKRNSSEPDSEDNKSASDMPAHHEVKPSVQSCFLKDVKALIHKFEQLGNPFQDDSATLSSLQSKHVIEHATAAAVCTILEEGKRQYCKRQYGQFVKERLVDRSVSLFRTLKRNKLAPFAVKQNTRNSKSKQHVARLKNDCVLFSQLYIGCQARSGDIDEFFNHENQRAPPSLSDGGKLRCSNKSDLLQCLESITSKTKHVPLDGLAVILDGAALVQMLKPVGVKTFSEYAVDIFMPFIASQLRTACRVDLVWDRYDSISLKATTRERRGIGIRCHVTADTPIPRNWPVFLRSDDNKTELFNFLSNTLAEMPLEFGKELVLTLGRQVLTLPCRDDLAMLSPCSHEEADTRMILHAADAGCKGIRRIMIKTVDTDVVVLAVAHKQQIACDELWIAFGVGNHFRYIAAHELAAALGSEKAKALTVFHAFTGCDTTSSFAGKGKKSAWETWTNFPQVTNAFLEMYLHSAELSESCLAAVERFVVLLYDRASTSGSVNSTRKQLFNL